jgi:hypothetical protein
MQQVGCCIGASHASTLRLEFICEGQHGKTLQHEQVAALDNWSGHQHTLMSDADDSYIG